MSSSPTVPGIWLRNKANGRGARQTVERGRSHGFAGGLIFCDVHKATGAIFAFAGRRMAMLLLYSLIMCYIQGCALRIFSIVARTAGYSGAFGSFC